MIKICGREVNIDHFPDGTLLIKEDVASLRVNLNTNYFSIEWYFEKNEELTILQFLAAHLKSNGVKVRLFMPYIPNARQDRVRKIPDIFTLKYFAEIINSIGFEQIRVLDPHSAVSEALFDNLIVMQPTKYIFNTIDNIGEVTLFYPDEGASKRYASLIAKPYVFGIKKRNWEDGKITGLDVVGDTERIKGKNILIVDDICSYGGTFYWSALKLKELGAKDIYLYITHCENSILEGSFGENKVSLLDTGLIKKVYTTDSIFAKNHEKITIMKI